ncbi:MAG: pseudouridine synthase [Chloroflexi bacterium HGW-Chloroflexi-10]|nr:MAG: pseudouridine synthase [Chloroflexi bacterium HGW-Chloroflexi-10]
MGISIKKQKFYYVKFHKPYGVMCTFTDPEGRATIGDYISIPNIYAAGRLDLDSEGLVFLTDDGWINHRITSPQFHLPKTYLVQVEGKITPEAINALRIGPVIKGGFQTQRCQVLQVSNPGFEERIKPVTPHGETGWLRIVLREGKKRQVRHMTAAVGLPTLRLVRVSIGPLALGDLKPGEWAELSDQELMTLKNNLKNDPNLHRRMNTV